MSRSLFIKDSAFRMTVVLVSPRPGDRPPACLIKKIESAMGRLNKGLKPEAFPLLKKHHDDGSFREDRHEKDRSAIKTLSVAVSPKAPGMIEPHMATMLSYVMTDAAMDGQLDAVSGKLSPRVSTPFR